MCAHVGLCMCAKAREGHRVAYSIALCFTARNILDLTDRKTQLPSCFPFP